VHPTVLFVDGARIAPSRPAGLAPAFVRLVSARLGIVEQSGPSVDIEKKIVYATNLMRNNAASLELLAVVAARMFGWRQDEIDNQERSIGAD